MRTKLAVALELLITDPGYKTNMHRLKQLQDPIDGATKAAQEIVGFLNESN